MRKLGVSLPMEEPGQAGSDNVGGSSRSEKQTETTTDEVEIREAAPLDPEGGNSEPPVSEEVHDQEEHHGQEEEVEDQNQNQNLEGGEGTQNENAQPVLRRSTRIKKPASNWNNTRVYFNAEAVAHPPSGVCSLAHYPEEHQAFVGSLDQEWIPRTFAEAMEDDE